MSDRPTVSWDQALSWRLHRQLLLPRAGQDPASVVSRLVGVQAQVPAAARLAITTRTAPGAAHTLPTDPEEVVAEASLLRTWAMRGTLHLLSVPDATDALALLSMARTWERSSWQRTFAPAEVVARLVDLVGEALSDGPLTREQLINEVSGQVSPEVTDRLQDGWSTLLKPLAWQGVLCQGPHDGGRATFTRPDLAVSGWPGFPDPSEASPRMILAYLSGYGPATPEAFDQWLLRGSTPKSRMKEWLAAARHRIAEVDIEGRTALLPTDDLDDLLATRPTSVVRLLPGFDQYLLGPGTKDTAILPAARRQLVSRTAGRISPVVLRAGRVVGVWELRTDTVDFSLFPGEAALPRAEWEEELAVLSAALGRKLELTMPPIREASGRARS